MNMSVCLSVCLSARMHISKCTHPNFNKFSPCATCYVLPVLWMTSYFLQCALWLHDAITSVLMHCCTPAHPSCVVVSASCFTLRWAPSLDESLVQGLTGQSMRHTVVLLCVQPNVCLSVCLFVYHTNVRFNKSGYPENLELFQ